MMHAERSIDIAAPAETIFRLAQDVQRWPEILPHYRSVSVVGQTDRGRVVEMAARRGWIPVRWTALQTLDPVTPSIGFEHLSGWTRGMQVAWRFERRPASTRVTIVHELRAPRGALRTWFERRIVGDYFIDAIAGRTLACMKRIAEAT